MTLPRLWALAFLVALAAGPVSAAPRKDDPKKDNPAGSNLKGKIEDTQWSAVGQKVGQVDLPAGFLKLEFGKDGSFVYTVGTATYTGTYELKAGDAVTLRLDKELAGKKTHEQTIVLKGDRLTVTDKDDTAAEFERVK